MWAIDDYLINDLTPSCWYSSRMYKLKFLRTDQPSANRTPLQSHSELRESERNLAVQFADESVEYTRKDRSIEYELL